MCWDPSKNQHPQTEPDPTERVRTEYQRFYDFVADCDPAIIDAWHFTENAAASRRVKG
jgi:hypothetical protein